MSNAEPAANRSAWSPIASSNSSSASVSPVCASTSIWPTCPRRPLGSARYMGTRQHKRSSFATNAGFPLPKPVPTVVATRRFTIWQAMEGVMWTELSTCAGSSLGKLTVNFLDIISSRSHIVNDHIVIHYKLTVNNKCLEITKEKELVIDAHNPRRIQATHTVRPSRSSYAR